MLHIPLAALHEARANNFEKSENYFRSVESFIDADLVSKAHDLTLSRVAPAFIISNSKLEKFKQLLLNFKSLPNWSVGGEVYFDYLRLLELSSVSQTTDELKSVVDKLINNLELIETANAQAKVARTLMLKKLIHTIFDRGLDYPQAKLTSFELPSSETNYLNYKINEPKLIEG
ncbi:unnamed protein product [Ambrosiozyma monospora]|uniref:Unnamed protein product n=1 Tax=Ambrosiozyma monospora TaxID=43982 RepID=A0A9W6WGQ2_AMBMO|nr:unnamed protein product [Ambrosiozyma monospora]